MYKVIGCILVALALGFIIVIDVISVAPVFSIYMEWIGLFLAILAGVLYLMYHINKNRGDDGDLYSE